MRTIVFIRHAKSLHPEYVSRDIERHLAARGYSDALESAKWCLSQKLVPDSLITSPAVRAYTTAMIFANVYAYPINKLVLHAAIYNAADEALFYVLNEMDDKHQCVFVFGHNPGMTDVVNLLCGNVIGHLPTAGVAVVNVDCTSWSDIKPGTANLKTVFSNHKELE